MGYQQSFRVWRGDDEGGDFEDYDVEVNEGEVVLDVIHRLQATQTPDLAVRELAVGHQTSEFGARPRAARRPVVGPSGAEDEVLAIGV